MAEPGVDSVFLRHEPCPACGSSDALARYSSGVGHCFSCNVSQAPDAESAPAEPEDRSVPARGLLGPVVFHAITRRRLTEETCRHWRYGLVPFRGQVVQVAQYASREGRAIAAQKWRTRDKDFGWAGDPKAAETLYGRHLCRDAGKRLIITEGEIDALSVSQVLELRWPVVSLCGGAGSAVRCVRENLEWLERFDEVVLMFDQDEPGQEAAQAAAAILSPGKARIARLPLKDANEMLKAGRMKELVEAQWEAQVWRPDGILTGDALWARATAEPAGVAVPYPWTGLNEKLAGLRRKELVTVCAGTSVGKSSFCRELAVHLLRAGERVGIVALEENAQQTLLGLLSVLNQQNYRVKPAAWPDLEPTWRAHLSDRLAVLDHFGSTEVETLESRIRYLVKGVGCGWIILDHITMAVAGEDRDRQAIDALMVSLRRLVEETGCGMIVVSQLKRRQGPGFETGADPQLSDLRGSSSIEQTSDVVIALARNQAEGDESVRVLVRKNRPLGLTGEAGALEWVHEAGAYREVEMFSEETTT